MTQTDKTKPKSLIVPFSRQNNSEEIVKDIRQERLDQLMKSFEDGFPGFYQALEALSQESKSQSPK